MKGVGYRMKKTLLLLYIAFLILFLSGCGIFNLNGWITPADDDFIACIEELDTPQKIGDYMIENLLINITLFMLLTLINYGCKKMVIATICQPLQLG